MGENKKEISKEEVKKKGDEHSQKDVKKQENTNENKDSQTQQNQDNHQEKDNGENNDKINNEESSSSEKKSDENDEKKKVEETDGGEELSIDDFKKENEELQNEISILESEKENYYNRMQRQQADFSNYRKRVEKEKGRIKLQTTVDIINDILPVLDNFERALEQIDKEDDFNKGVKMIYKQLITFLDKQGVKEIEALGDEFDHNFHQAVMQVESDEHDSGIVVEVIQKGYILEGKVIRPAMVKVVM